MTLADFQSQIRSSMSALAILCQGSPVIHEFAS